MVAYRTMFVDLLLSKHNHNGAAARCFLLVLGVAFDAWKLRTATLAVCGWLKGVVQDFGHRTSFPIEPVCYLSLETVCNTLYSVLLVAEIACARLAQAEGIC